MPQALYHVHCFPGHQLHLGDCYSFCCLEFIPKRGKPLFASDVEGVITERNKSHLSVDAPARPKEAQEVLLSIGNSDCKFSVVSAASAVHFEIVPTESMRPDPVSNLCWQGR